MRPVAGHGTEFDAIDRLVQVIREHRDVGLTTVQPSIIANVYVV
jgi:hypothetical protein